ncbi:NR LBD domain-containing protein [Caenorhabditis elegans]|nr:NR LBD domain-containing protein [Caenorhabditis elegans]CTQ86776.1 NR LBD domain-containing protein [Caenorhabditis elegans]|eukprot:NP_001300077.1 Nuclear Hormone Receptor family [Caenorhabditis elegans]
MTPSNIQYDRDAYKSSVKKIKDSAENITEPKRDATSLILINKTSQVLPYVDLSQLVNKATRMLLNPIFTKKTKKMSNLEQLTHGLIELQWSQKDNLAEVVHLSVSDVTQDMERSMFGAAKWMMCSERIRNYQDSLKIRILQAIWYTWGRLERIATTAKLRLEKKCEEKHFVFSPMFALNLDEMSFDASCWTTLPFEEMQYFYVPRELFYEDAVLEMMEVKPNDVETTFIICSICFHLTGKRFGGEIQEKMDHLQDVLSNDLHEYYLKNKNSMYLRRLKQLMRIKENFLKLRSARMDKYEIGGFFNSFNPRISNPEFFEVLS